MSGRRLTLALTTLLVVVLAVGATAAWSVGRHRDIRPAAIADYQAGPTADHTVRLSTEAARHGQATQVQAVMQQYFDAINQRDYQSWVGAVSEAQSAPQTEDRWLQDYSSTTDSNLSVLVIADEPLRARLMFTSQQAIELAPPSLAVDCINWDVTYLLSEQNGQLVLSGIDPSAQSMTACSS
ncbi:MAG: hypothetical protein ABWZ98_13765 [Nakamurella sp.]